MMMPAAANRTSWQHDYELELGFILRQMGLDELRAAKRLISREISRREQEGDRHELSQADKALFRV